MNGDGEDAQPVTVDAVDARGRHVPTANLPASFAIDGGQIIGLGNGNPNDHDPEKGDARKLFNGLAQVIVRADRGAGTLRLRATAPGLKSASLTVTRLPAEARAAVARTRPEMLLGAWQRLPWQAERPDPNYVAPDNDRFAQNVARPGRLDGPSGNGRWIAYHIARFRPQASVRKQGGVIAFTEIAGRAEVWLDGAGWVPVDPADVRKVALEEPPTKLVMDDPKVVAARHALFGSWETNWLAYNDVHDVKLPGSDAGPLGFFMYPQAETVAGMLDCLDPDNFRYSITAREVTA